MDRRELLLELNNNLTDVKQIEEWVKERLKHCFPYVAEPMPLPKSGAQLFSLFFCVSNPSGKAIGLAKKAANHILKQH